MTVGEIIALIQLIEEVGPPLFLMIKSFVDLITKKNPDKGVSAISDLLKYAMIEVQAFANADFGAGIDGNKQKRFDAALEKVKEICKDIDLVVTETDLRNAIQGAYSIFKAGNMPMPAPASGGANP